MAIFVSLVYLINLMSLAVLAIVPDGVHDRLANCITLFLSLVALNFIIAGSIPKYVSDFFFFFKDEVWSELTHFMHKFQI
jgi:hypothetical protein